MKVKPCHVITKFLGDWIAPTTYTSPRTWSPVALESGKRGNLPQEITRMSAFLAPCGMQYQAISFTTRNSNCFDNVDKSKDAKFVKFEEKLNPNTSLSEVMAVREA
ncbi:uncharacterized protein MYCFIDRAFT_171077 [Pseudocercospora fijiensis CIRAD86]|uniref:Uncharacterized protein n=1 Tax=Pseudocercospora fijiensis (strain CIRAD86) TaxID=383855 RepID=N1QD28_PSEFD|nr:uncharacterized protein MYCFIDRAFT_171077 [Pseudocercospora fijiensis CIRAD86]EME89658.1 hypothetical protein MYCFIDRAFT_171077 [Pseudocercospora fijiensis CIRAD86]